MPQSEGSAGAVGKTDASGKYSLTTFQPGDGAIPGTYQVTVSKVVIEAGISEEESNAYLARGETPPAPTEKSLLPEKYKSPGKHWPEFAKKLRRLLADAIRLWRAQDELPGETYASRRRRLDARLAEMIETDWQDIQAGRLIKRLRRHQHDLFTFLDQPGVPFDNNHAERSIRPAVILRKNSYGNRSERGADCQAVLMSVFRTLKQRGHDPIRTTIEALTLYLNTKRLPPLPQNASDG